MRYFVVLLLAGCAGFPFGSSNEWNHATRDRSEWKADEADCVRFFGSSDRDIDRCMATKGWKRGK